MKKIVIAALCFFIIPARAEWSNIGVTNGKNLFIDHSTIQKNGKFVSVWQLTDDTKQLNNGSNALSIAAHIEYDCKDEKVRFLAALAYTGNMQSGKSFSIYSQPTQWDPILPNSTIKFTFNLACHEWKQVLSTGDMKVFVDSVTSRKRGSFVTLWFLYNYTYRNYGALSVRNQIEYDCKGLKKRFLVETAHSGPMATGEILVSRSTNTPTEWRQIDMEIDKEAILPIICN